MTGAREIRVKIKAIPPTIQTRPFRRVTALLLLVLLILSLFMDTPVTKVAQAERRDVQESCSLFSTFRCGA
jgi:hypothetical protein